MQANDNKSRWWLTAVGTAAVGGAAVLSGTFDKPLGAQDPAKPPEKADKKAEPAKPDEKKPAFDPKDVRVGPPPELDALRKAVEDAGKKGENVEEIRRQLGNLEKALAGKPWLKPKVEPEPRADLPRVAPGFGGVPFNGPFGGGVDPRRLQMDEMRRLAEALRNNPNDPDAMLRMFGGPGGNPFDPFAGMPRGGNGRFGVAMDVVTPQLREQLDLPADRGVVVVQVRPDSPAEKAGLKANDVILEFAGKPVSADMRAFAQAVMDAKAGEKFDITVMRKGKKEVIKGVELPEAKARERGAFRPGFGGGFGGFGVPGGGLNSTYQLRLTDDGFTLTATKDGVEYTIDGTRDDGQLTPTKIVVKDGDQSHTAETVDKVPEAYRGAVKNLLSRTGIQRPMID